MSESVTGTDRTVELTRCREFRLTDAMILFSRGALAFWASSRLLLLLADMLGRPCREAIVHRADLLTQWSLFWRDTHDPLRNTLWYGLEATLTFLLGMIPAFFVLRLRRPRPPLHALLRQPGTVASLAIVLGLFWAQGVCSGCSLTRSTV